MLGDLRLTVDWGQIDHVLDEAADNGRMLALLDAQGRFLLTKLVGGGFRVGVSRQLVQRAIAEHSGLDPRLVAQRMVG